MANVEWNFDTDSIPEGKNVVVAWNFNATKSNYQLEVAQRENKTIWLGDSCIHISSVNAWLDLPVVPHNSEPAK